ncbi:MAG: fasciclin domain-containing protein [Bacteroidota bacterium]
MTYLAARFPLALLTALSLLLFVGCGQDEAASSDRAAAGDLSGQGLGSVVEENSDPNILAVAIGSEDHTTLVAAVQAAELENTLGTPGPLTVFAPTNAAFDALPDGALDDLLKPENKQTLANVVTSHAAPASFPMDKLVQEDSIYMATGHHLTVEEREDGTYVNGAKILGTVPASNGIVHVVDQVFLVALDG